MAQVQPSPSNAPPPATNGQPAASSSNPLQLTPISLEDDRMPAGGAAEVGNKPSQQGKSGSMTPPPSPAHRAENANVQNGAGMMMPPPAQQEAHPEGVAVPVKNRRRLRPRVVIKKLQPTLRRAYVLRPASRSGAGAPSNTNALRAPPSMSQGSGGDPATPTSAGRNNSSSNPTAPSPPAVMTNLTSPSAATNSLPHPQTSGPDATAVENAGSNVPPPPPSSSVPPSTSGSSLPTNIFGDFFESMEDNFDAIDPVEFQRWIEMNPLS